MALLVGLRLPSLGLAAIIAVLGPLACSDASDEDALRETKAAKQTFTGRVKGTGGSGLRVREKATTESPQLTTLDEGAVVTISCRTRGETIEANPEWDFLPDQRGYVSDAFIVIDDGEADIPRCDASEPRVPAAAPERPLGGKVDIQGPDVRAHVQSFADEACAAVGACRGSTYVGHQPSADLALDIPSGEGYGKLPTDGHVFGDRVADYAVTNRAKFRIDYVIYRQRINFGEGWTAMEDRGSITQNHFDHVHVSFDP